MKKQKSFTTVFRLLFPIIHGHLAYVMVLLFFDNTDQLFNLFFRQEVLLLIVMSYFFNEGFLVLIRWIDKRYPDPAKIVSRFATQLLLSVLWSFFVVASLTYAYFNYVIDFSVFQTELLVFMSIYTISCLLMNLYSFSLIYLNTQNDSIMLEENQKKISLSYQIQAFQNQVNPRFFYQSLESLILIAKNGGRTVDDFVGKLSAVYRYKLDNQQSEVTSLKEELVLAENILYVLNFHLGQQIYLNSKSLSEDKKQALMITGALGDIMLYIVHSTILSQNIKLEIRLEFDQTGQFLQCDYQCKERILIDDETQKQWLDLQHAYSRLSSFIPEKKRHGDQITINIPVLNLQEEPL